MNVKEEEDTVEIEERPYVEIARSFVSLHPSYTRLKLTYSVYCRHRYHFDKLKHRRQFMRELHKFEKLQVMALDGVRVHREFSDGILSHRIPPRRYMEFIVKDPLTKMERMRLNDIIEGKALL